jgi:hypothetical protein
VHISPTTYKKPNLVQHYAGAGVVSFGLLVRGGSRLGTQMRAFLVRDPDWNTPKV